MFNYKKGILRLIVDSAEILRDTEAVGKMDPYVTLSYKGLNNQETKLKTNVIDEGGKNPKWKDQEFVIIISSPDNIDTHPDIDGQINVRLWDEDTTTSDPIGFCVLKFSQLCFNGGSDRYYNFYWEGQKAGKIRLISQFIDDEREKNVLHFENVKYEYERVKTAIESILPPAEIKDQSNIYVNFNSALKNGLVAIESTGQFSLPNETIDKIFDESGKTKFCCCYDEDNQVKVNIKFVRPISISGYGIQSSNDFPARDPRKWKLTCELEQGIEKVPEIFLNKDGQLEVNEFCDPFVNRFQFQNFKLPIRVWIRSLKIVFSKDWEGYNPIAASEYGLNNQETFQLSEFQLYV